MKLKKINIVHFGQLSNLTFELPSDELNVFFGENEAGKSTTVAFIKQVMFGFYLRSSSSPFFEDYIPLAHVSPMGGSLVFEDENGAIFEIERLWAKGDKTKRGILTVKKDGQVVPESLFYDQIQNISGTFYSDSFIFNQDTLRQVATLSQGDLLERIYYLGASNSSKLLQMRDQFDKEASNLFKKTGKKPEVNQLILQYQTERDNLKGSEDEFNEYKSLENSLKNDQHRLTELQQVLTKLEKQKQKIANLSQQLVNFKKLQTLKSEVKDLHFNKDDYQKAQNLASQINNLEVGVKDTENKIANLQLDPNFDYQHIKELVQKRQQLLQWQSEDQSYRQKAQEISLEQEQLVQINPDLTATLKLSNVQFEQMKSDYQNLPKENLFENENLQESKNFWNQYGLGGILILIGMVGILFGKFLALFIALLTVGAILIGISGYQKKQKNEKKSALIANKQKQILEKRQTFKDKYQIDPDQLNIQNLQNAYTQYHFKEKTKKINQEHLLEINKNLESLTSQLENTLKRPIDANFTDLFHVLDELDEKLAQYRHAQDIKTNLQADLANNQNRLKELKLELKTVLVKNQVETIEDFQKFYQEFLTQTELKAQISVLNSGLKDILPELEKIDNADKLDQQIKEIDQQIAAQRKQLDDERSQVAKIEVEMHNLTDSAELFKEKQNHANTETKLTNASKEYLANLFAAEVINRALDIASNERFPKMLSAARAYFESLTGGRYTDILLDKKIKVVKSNGKKIDVKYLSRATAEQLYFALKLAFVGQINDKINLPVLIDDSFVNFDENRISHIKELLIKLSQKNQVLIFTAQKNLVKQLALTPLTYAKGNNNA